MQNSKALTCYNCDSLVLNLSDSELKKLNGLNFRCECCGHENSLKDFAFIKGTNENDPYVNVLSIDNVLFCK
jgi:RNase P subunit RPR2